MITREKFIEVMGREPEMDDLARCNCLEAGAVGHLSCGWDDERNLPQFVVGPRKWNGQWPLKGH